ncbi:unnamed protein product, partial [Ectocarpus sp. 12 AP-2014]
MKTTTKSHCKPPCDSGAGGSIDSRTAGRYTVNRTACLDYL